MERMVLAMDQNCDYGYYDEVGGFHEGGTGREETAGSPACQGRTAAGARSFHRIFIEFE